MQDIVLKNLSKSFGEKQVLSGLNLRLEAGKITAVMGPSGLGKTTLLRILLGLEAYEGEISGLSGLRIAAVFQESRLLPWMTLQQNLEFAAPKNGTDSGAAGGLSIADALAMTELEGSQDKKPGELSGGMQRRAALARALAYGGDLYILDEPYSALDEELKGRLAARLTDYWRKRQATVIFVTHDSQEAAGFADRVVKLQDLNKKEENR